MNVNLFNKTEAEQFKILNIVNILPGKNVIIGQKPKLDRHTLAKKALLTQ